MITSPGWTQVFLVLALFAVLELIGSNFVEPLLYGQGIGVSVVAYLLSAAFWTWIWGAVGLILSAPLTVCVVVMGKYVPALAFLDRLLGDEPPLEPHVAFLQRLLAKDQNEAEKIVQDFQSKHPPETVYDEVLIPALTLARQDRARGATTVEEESFILNATRQIIAERATPPKGKTVTEGPPESAPTGDSRSDEEAGPSEVALQDDVAAEPSIVVLGCPAHHESEELSLQMLGELLRAHHVRVNILSTKIIPLDVIQHVKRQAPALVVIAGLPPGGMIQAQYLCKRLRKSLPELPIVVGYWGCRGNLDKIITRLRLAGAQYITTTVLGARGHVLSVVSDIAATNLPAPQAVPQPATASR